MSVQAFELQLVTDLTVSSTLTLHTRHKTPMWSVPTQWKKNMTGSCTGANLSVLKILEIFEGKPKNTCKTSELFYRDAQAGAGGSVGVAAWGTWSSKSDFSCCSCGNCRDKRGRKSGVWGCISLADRRRVASAGARLEKTLIKTITFSSLIHLCLTAPLKKGREDGDAWRRDDGTG